MPGGPIVLTLDDVAEKLNLPRHVLRFWGTKFKQVKPLELADSTLCYREGDVALLRGIKYLLYSEGYTISEVERFLEEHGIHRVMTLWRDSDSKSGPADPEVSKKDWISEELESLDPWQEVGSGSQSSVIEPEWLTQDPNQFPEEDQDLSKEDQDVLDDWLEEDQDLVDQAVGAAISSTSDTCAMCGRHLHKDESDSGLESLFEGPEQVQSSSRLSGSDVRQLHEIVFELLECKRLLDQTF